MNRNLILITLLGGSTLLPAVPAQAAESYDNCAGFITSLPATITTQGVWCMERDLSTNLASGNAITIATNNVVIDCNEFKIGNLAAGPGTDAVGIRAAARLNSVVRNCNIRGFYRGIYFSDGGGHLIEKNRFDGNLGYGVHLFVSPGSTIRNNLIFDTGGSSLLTNFAVGISASGGVHILDNTVHDIAGTGAGEFYPTGIVTGSNSNGRVNGNRITALSPAGGGTPRGIVSDNSGREIIRGNDVQGPGPQHSSGFGIVCTNAMTTAHQNVVVGFETGIAGCFSNANVLNPN